MKLPALPRPSRRVGSVLLVTLLISMVIGITLAAFILKSAVNPCVMGSFGP